MKSRSVRTLAVLASAGLLVGAFAVGPADAAKKKKFACPAGTAAVPSEGHSSNADEAAEAPVVNVTAAATEEKPLVTEYEHGPAFSEAHFEDTKYFAYQVVSKTPGQGLYIKMEWPGMESDIDMYMYDAGGTEVARSAVYNPLPVGPLGGTGGQGFEFIPGFPADPCSPYTIESKAYATMGEPMKISVWLGEAGDSYDTP